MLDNADGDVGDAGDAPLLPELQGWEVRWRQLP